MDTQSIITAIFSAPAGWNIALGLFIIAAACMAVNYSRQIVRLQKQNERLIFGVQKILTIAETMSGQTQGAE